jgi:hypothetical protein
MEKSTAEHWANRNQTLFGGKRSACGTDYADS